MVVVVVAVEAEAAERLPEATAAREATAAKEVMERSPSRSSRSTLASMKLKTRYISFVTLLFGTIALSGCSSAWWQSFQADPVATIHSFEARASSYVTTAEAVVDGVLPYLGDDGPAIGRKLATAKLAVTHTLAALEDAVSAAASLKQDVPNWKQAVADVLAAADDLQAVVEEVKMLISQKPASTTMSAAMMSVPTLNGYDELQAQRRALERFRQ